MSRIFPYTYIACPCASNNQSFIPTEAITPLESPDPESYEELSFDPRAARSNFSLFPPEHLLHCIDCHQIRCPRCTTEEIQSWYCPNCLFETPSALVKSEGNRCARNCFNCPVCMSPLSVNGIGDTKDSGLQSYIMSCGYCQWSTLDIGIKFDKPSNIRSQLAKLTNNGAGMPSRKDTSSESGPLSPLSPRPDDKDNILSPNKPVTSAVQFSELKSFYRSQLASTSTLPGDSHLAGLSGSDYTSYSSPSALNRIMSLYTASSNPLSKTKSKTRPPIMREALKPSEGLHLTKLSSSMQDPSEITTDLSQTSWSAIPSLNQRITNPSLTPVNAIPRMSSLLPIPTHLSTKRAKRCLACRHILVRPEVKPQSTRFRIRLLALSWVPLVTLKPLPASPTPSNTFPLNFERYKLTLTASQPTNFVLTLHNQIFDPINVTLSTPATTPGRFPHRITVLCPSFSVGANSDLFEDALSGPAPNTNLALPASRSRDKTSSSESSTGVEAGKIWAKGRNWTSVILEVVPASLQLDGDEELDEDEDLLEIPVFLRLEYETDPTDEEKAEAKKSADVEDWKNLKVVRELAYWMVVGIGSVAR